MRFPLLEPGSEPTTAGYPTDFQVALSQAISLKRIADSLDRLASADKQAALTAQNLVEQLRLSAEAQSRLTGDDYAKWNAPPKTDDNPWIDWPGGECPVPDGTLVDVAWRDGSAMTAVSAGYGPASRILWEHDISMDNNIVAYRISK